jgi:hypothetical protein
LGEREAEPIVALAREIRYANEELAESHARSTAVLGISTDDLDEPLLVRAEAARLFVAAIREANRDYSRRLTEAADDFDTRVRVE